jgi:hypothetical protein
MLSICYLSYLRNVCLTHIAQRIGDVELGIQTIHMQLSKALGDAKKQDQYLSNVALKANTKNGGINHKVRPSYRPHNISSSTSSYMLCGSSRVMKSKRYFNILFIFQETDKFIMQMLDELKAMMVERLAYYERKNKALPERIFVFRDGVSEVCALSSDAILPLMPPLHRANTTQSCVMSFLKYLTLAKSSTQLEGKLTVRKFRSLFAERGIMQSKPIVSFSIIM